jgi:hypothetical protein
VRVVCANTTATPSQQRDHARLCCERARHPQRDKSGEPSTKVAGADRRYLAARVRSLARGDNTITAWTRYYERIIDAHGKSHWLIIAAVILGLLVGHLTWH